MKNILFAITFICSSIISLAQNNTLYPGGLKVGDVAPNFIVKDQNGVEINLKNILKKQEVVLVFYRGQWCPYCNKQLKKISDSLAFIQAKGATVMAITPETIDNVNKTVEKTAATYSIISDNKLALMQRYKVSFVVDENTVTKYKNYGVDFNVANGENGTNLPVPATYIIGKNGKIKYAFFNTDYKQRASVKEILENL